MATMANPMDALIDYQRNVDTFTLSPEHMVDSFLRLQGPKADGFTVEFIKIAGREVQAIAIFALENEKLNGLHRFSMGYAVAEKHRRRGLALEAITTGIKELERQVRLQGVKKFFVEALIDNSNAASIQLAKKVFPGEGQPMVDSESGTPSLFFCKLVEAR